MTFECDGKADEMDEDEDHDHNAYRGKKVMVAKVQAKIEYSVKICQAGVDDAGSLEGKGMFGGMKRMMSKEGRASAKKDVLKFMGGDFKADPNAAIFSVHDVDPAQLLAPKNGPETQPVIKCCCMNKGDVSISGSVNAGFVTPGAEGKVLIEITNTSSVRVTPAVKLIHFLQLGETKDERLARSKQAESLLVEREEKLNALEKLQEQVQDVDDYVKELEERLPEPLQEGLQELQDVVVEETKVAIAEQGAAALEGIEEVLGAEGAVDAVGEVFGEVLY